MKASTRANLKAWAIAWISTRAAPAYLTQYQQKAIAIHNLLSDGEWRNARDIGSAIGLKTCTTRNLLGSLKEPFGLVSHRAKGYKLKECQQPRAKVAQLLA